MQGDKTMLTDDLGGRIGHGSIVRLYGGGAVGVCRGTKWKQRRRCRPAIYGNLFGSIAGMYRTMGPMVVTEHCNYLGPVRWRRALWYNGTHRWYGIYGT